ncbi:MBL fold metallo-hydrolase [Sneathiella limimaris]|uniref:MBL fold metallo-hydrolase n=1 Tax=Sneathiella limimaris TaxID=1964213 RepID=UPI00146D7CA4|nr:MBL fold metallo-hydrolase [Sneathiella limimaris]
MVLRLCNAGLFKLALSGVILFFLTGCSGEFRKFWEDSIYATYEIKPSYQGATARFLGVSSFLIKDNDTTIMIDGYLSRPDQYLYRPISPNNVQIETMLCALAVKMNAGCSDNKSNKDNLDAVFAMHGHFDHALDSPLIACLTGATLVGGPVLLEIADRTKRFFPSICQQISHEYLDENLSEYSFDYDPISVTLIKVKHSENIASKLLENASYDPDWAFPAKITQMKEGISVAAHLKLRQGSILIVPTAGEINQEFHDKRFEADTIFLGIGALGFECEEKAKKYWNNTVVASKAKWVIPIHWDSLSGPLDPESAVLDIPYYERLDRVLQWFQKFAADDPDVTVRPVPIFKSFDPFFSRLDQ